MYVYNYSSHSIYTHLFYLAVCMYVCMLLAALRRNLTWFELMYVCGTWVRNTVGCTSTSVTCMCYRAGRCTR